MQTITLDLFKTEWPEHLQATIVGPVVGMPNKAWAQIIQPEGAAEPPQLILAWKVGELWVGGPKAPEATTPEPITTPAMLFAAVLYQGLPGDLTAREQLSLAYGVPPAAMQYAEPTAEQIAKYEKSDPRAPLVAFIFATGGTNPAAIAAIDRTRGHRLGCLFRETSAATAEQITEASEHAGPEGVVPLIKWESL